MTKTCINVLAALFFCTSLSTIGKAGDLGVNVLYRGRRRDSLGIGLTCILLVMLTQLIFAAGAYSQSIIRSTTAAGGSSQWVISEGKSYFISQTIGQQSVIGTVSKNGNSIRQGFQQPPGVFFVGDPEINSDLDALVFPNPFQQALDILFREKIESDIQVVVLDVLGRIITSERHAAVQTLNLSLGHIASGSYLLQVASGNRSFTRRIIKQ